MAIFNKFTCFTTDLGLKRHDLNADTIKVMLTNEQPLAGDTVKGDMVEISATDYPAGGTDIQNLWSAQTMTATDVTFTASTATIGPFRFAVLYNDTGGTKYLVGWYDYISNITLQIGESFKVDFGASVLTDI